jgi:hypothetical protein
MPMRSADILAVELFKIRMQGQYGSATDRRLSVVFRDMWREWGFRRGIMRGFWVTVAREIPAYAGSAFCLQVTPSWLIMVQILHRFRIHEAQILKDIR